MKYNRVLISLLVIFFFTQIATSQNNNSSRSGKKINSEKTNENYFAKMQEKLGFDGLQIVIVKNIILKYNSKKTA